ncbi:AAA family ATPase [Streptomyces sp. NPDC001717]|uniref:AAA family ATPase n=1 Tax=Streptomyces sp. NPDC001717 TaxID=3364604 RepID=UPI0036A731A3
MTAPISADPVGRPPIPRPTADRGPDARPSRHTSPLGVLDLRGAAGRDVWLSYPYDGAVVVCGLPGSGKSTLLRAWSGSAPVVDPRATRTSFEAWMPAWLPYALYRPWARLRHMRWLRDELRRGGPLLIHDCGSRSWMRWWLARTARGAGRPLHMVVLDVGPQEALSGQRARRRLASRRVFARHQRGLTRLLRQVDRGGLAGVPGFHSVVALDLGQRERVTEVRFAPPADA